MPACQPALKAVLIQVDTRTCVSSGGTCEKALAPKIT